MLTMTDLFCGAGGSSTGALQVPGIDVSLAMNHWERAIETHNANHPETDHICADIQVTDPRYVRRTDILWASPECTNHSVAKGRARATNQPDLFGDTIADEAAERSRATMWDVPRFAEYHNYKIIVTENVVDAARWVMFDAWLHAMHSLGYDHKVVYLNSMHAQMGGLPAPQSRDRMYVVFWKKGNPAPDFQRLRPHAHCPEHGRVQTMQVFKRNRWGRYRAQYEYRCPHTSCQNRVVEPDWLPAASAIDWTIKGQKIGERARPLVPKTMARIKAGLERFGAQRMSIDAVRGAPIINPVDREPFSTQTTSYTRGLLVPVEGREGKRAESDLVPMRTQTTRNETGVLVPPAGAHLVEYYGNGGVQTVADPIPTLTTVDRFALMQTHKPPSREWTETEINECEFRMLEPHEITAGMAFPKDYIMTGNKREQVRQAGNAVTPPAARDLLAVATATLN